MYSSETIQNRSREINLGATLLIPPEPRPHANLWLSLAIGRCSLGEEEKDDQRQTQNTKIEGDSACKGRSMSDCLSNIG